MSLRELGNGGQHGGNGGRRGDAGSGELTEMDLVW
jgi:hypothetical protein